MPKHVKLIGGTWHYFRRVPREFASVDSRRFVKRSLRTDSRSIAERLAARQADDDDRRWHALSLAALEEDEARRKAAEAEAEDAYAGAMKLARLHSFPYRTAREIADDASLAEILARIRKTEKAGFLDTTTTGALIGLVEPPRNTFRACAEKLIEAHTPGASGEDEAAGLEVWRNPKHRAQWASTLKAYVYPTIGELDVADIDVGLVLRCLEPIWRSKPETARRVRMRIEAVLDWAAASGFRDRDNPARWKGHLDKLLPGRRRTAGHHAALPFAELPAFAARLRQLKGIAARALEFTILTAARSGETRGATWREIDLKAAVWTVPADRMKAEREHRVPLSPAAVAILQTVMPEQVKPGDVVFPSPRGGALSDMALLAVLRDMDRSDITVHGFRSSFRDWAAESTAHPDFVVEKALAHIVADKVEAAYRRGDLFAKRRKLMEDWARFCTSGKAGRRRS